MTDQEFQTWLRTPLSARVYTSKARTHVVETCGGVSFLLQRQVKGRYKLVGLAAPPEERSSTNRGQRTKLTVQELTQRYGI